MKSLVHISRGPVLEDRRHGPEPRPSDRDPEMVRHGPKATHQRSLRPGWDQTGIKDTGLKHSFP